MLATSPPLNYNHNHNTSITPIDTAASCIMNTIKPYNQPPSITPIFSSPPHAPTPPPLRSHAYSPHIPSPLSPRSTASSPIDRHHHHHQHTRRWRRSSDVNGTRIASASASAAGLGLPCFAGFATATTGASPSSSKVSAGLALGGGASFSSPVRGGGGGGDGHDGWESGFGFGFDGGGSNDSSVANGESGGGGVASRNAFIPTAPVLAAPIPRFHRAPSRLLNHISPVYRRAGGIGRSGDVRPGGGGGGGGRRGGSDSHANGSLEANVTASSSSSSSASAAMAKRRRDLFLNKVRLGREERRWDERGEQILRLDWQKQMKRWERELERAAPVVAVEDEDDDDVYEDEGDGGDVKMGRGLDGEMVVAMTDREGEVEMDGELPDRYARMRLRSSHGLRQGQAQGQGQGQGWDRLGESGTGSRRETSFAQSRFSSIMRGCDTGSEADPAAEEVEAIAWRERQELEALVALMEDGRQGVGSGGSGNERGMDRASGSVASSGHFRSDDDDDEDLDGLLMGYAEGMDIAEKEVGPGRELSVAGGDGDGEGRGREVEMMADEMDLSH